MYTRVAHHERHEPPTVVILRPRGLRVGRVAMDRLRRAYDTLDARREASVSRCAGALMLIRARVTAMVCGTVGKVVTIV